jgi:hypothetical protein
MIDRVEDQLGIRPYRLIADTAYGTCPMLGWLFDDKKIEPHIPVRDKSERDDGTFSRSDFAWDERADEYRCPGDKPQEMPMAFGLSRNVRETYFGVPSAWRRSASCGPKSNEASVPRPGALSTTSRPPCSAMMDFTIASPSPAPSGLLEREGSAR